VSSLAVTLPHLLLSISRTITSPFLSANSYLSDLMCDFILPSSTTLASSFSFKAYFTLITFSLLCFETKPPAIAMLAASEAMKIFSFFILFGWLLNLKDITFLVLINSKF
jgi:hypothetical protein